MGILWLFLWFIPKQLGPSKEEIQAQQEWNRKYKEAEAVFNEQCKTAGEKIYRTVDNVEGIMLLKVPQENVVLHGSDPTFQDAALRHDNHKEKFIHDFLRYKAVRKDGNPIIRLTDDIDSYKTSHSYYKGYSFIDVKNSTGQIIRYSARRKNSRLLYDVNLITYPQLPARYAVTYKTKVYPNYWIATARVIILDTQTNNIIAEKTWHIFDRGLGSRAGARTPWLYASSYGHIHSSQSKIRLFVDKVLQPKNELK